jgi:O-antigen biosynthesis protein
MTPGLTEGKTDILEQLAEQYIRGKGVGTGDVPRGFPVPPGISIRQVHGSALAGNGGNIGIPGKPLANLDFCIAGHFLQYTGDPLTFLHRCLHVLRPGGILFVLIPCTSDPSAHIPALKRTLFSRASHISIDAPDPVIRMILKEEMIFALPVRIRWQGTCVLAGSREYVFVLERFDYFVQIQELLQKKVAFLKNRSCPADVIIPVYNAHDDLLRCLYSVMVHHENERIILIDDKSPDPGIRNLFSSLEPYQSSWFVLIQQEKNSGFAATVNRGMRLSRNDVILLNSDTIVTKDWVKKLQEGVGSVKNCGTMTPLTNNGTLCSVPVMMENNLLPPGISIDDYAHMVEKISFGQFPLIPTGIGFCLYITRACLDTTGYFDDVTFREGYGEENDFCLRARESGMTHHVCDTTYIYHRGMASFSAQAMTRLEKGIAALNARYPAYQDEVSRFIQGNPLHAIQENIACRATTWDFSGRSPRVLFIPGSENWNGCGRQTGESGDDGIYYILRCTPSEYCVSEYHKENCLDYSFPADDPSPGAFMEIIEKILCSFRISGIYLDQADTRVSDSAVKFHIPCIIASFSSEPATRNEKRPDQAQCMMSGDTCDSGFLVDPDQVTLSPLHERQEPDWSSGRRFTSTEIFNSIRVFPEARFKGVTPFRPETPGSLPARFLRCLSENGVFYTLQRIRFFIRDRKEETR